MKAMYPTSEALTHEMCNSSSCRLTCIAQVETSISLYHKELSRVIFKKENMRNKSRWWLSTFYSFCIQSFVKQCLVKLETHVSYGNSLACTNYMKLPVGLFVAISGNFDPLDADYSQPTLGDGEEHPGRDVSEYKEAQFAVSRGNWVAERISGSAEYVRSLFGDP